MEHFFDSRHLALRDEVRRFAERVVRPQVGRMEELRDVPHTFPAAGTSDVQRLRLAQVALGEYPTGWSERLRAECQSLVEPSEPIVQRGLCATSQA